MPRFNFALPPDDPKQPSQDGDTPTSVHGSSGDKPGTENVPESGNAPSSQPPEAPEASPVRQLRMDETIPVEYRTLVTFDNDPAAHTEEPLPTPADANAEHPRIEMTAQPPEEPAPEPIPPAKPQPVEETPHSSSDAVPEMPSEPSPNEPFEEQSTPAISAPGQKESDFDNPFADLDHEEYLTEQVLEQDSPEKKNKSFPIIFLAVIVIFLLGVSAIWYFDPYPPLRTTIEDFFSPSAPESPMQPPQETTDMALPADTLAEPDSVFRDWNYYVQISAFTELYKAQDDANRLRKLGVNAKVEGEFIPSQRKTYYRVRLGPYQTRERALIKADSLKEAIPATAFLDSMRVETDVDEPEETQPIVQPVLKKPARRASSPKPATAPPPKTPSAPATAKQTQTAPPPAEASSGYAVHVSSFTNLSTAQKEAKSLVGKGLPAYTSTTVQQGKTWYRVLVGPFRTKNEANRYLEIVHKEFGNTAYVRTIGK